MSNILVTGGAGFIGSHTAVSLLKLGHAVTILDDFNDRYDPRLKEARMKHMFAAGPQPAVVRGDILSRDLITKVFSEGTFDHVIHLAAWASVIPSLKNPYVYTAVNVDGTVNVLEAARTHHVKNFIFASTSSVYGGKTAVPFKETDDVTRPISPYAASKVAGEVMCATWHNIYQLPVTCLRFFTVYGPWGRPEMAMIQFANALMDNQPLRMRGRQTRRDFTYVDDIVSGVTAALGVDSGFHVCNLGEHDAVPLPRLIAALAKALNKQAMIEEVPLLPGEIPATLADITAAADLLGYHPATPIETGVQKFADWYLNWYRPNFMTKSAV